MAMEAKAAADVEAAPAKPKPTPAPKASEKPLQAREEEKGKKAKKQGTGGVACASVTWVEEPGASAAAAAAEAHAHALIAKYNRAHALEKQEQQDQAGDGDGSAGGGGGGGGGGDDAYERPLVGGREQSKDDRAMQHFQTRLERLGTQCVRYAWSSDELLWPAADRDAVAAAVPRCVCGAERGFEAQLMPPLQYFLEQQRELELGGELEPETAGDAAAELGKAVGMAWATAAVFVCRQACGANDGTVTFARESVQVAYES